MVVVYHYSRAQDIVKAHQLTKTRLAIRTDTEVECTLVMEDTEDMEDMVGVTDRGTNRALDISRDPAATKAAQSV